MEMKNEKIKEKPSDEFHDVCYDDFLDQRPQTNESLVAHDKQKVAKKGNKSIFIQATSKLSTNPTQPSSS